MSHEVKRVKVELFALPSKLQAILICSCFILLLLFKAMFAFHFLWHRAKSKDISDGDKTVTVGGKVSIITDKELFKECVVKRVHRESGLSVMLSDSSVP